MFSNLTFPRNVLYCLYVCLFVSFFSEISRLSRTSKVGKVRNALAARSRNICLRAVFFSSKTQLISGRWVTNPGPTCDGVKTHELAAVANGGSLARMQRFANKQNLLAVRRAQRGRMEQKRGQRQPLRWCATWTPRANKKQIYFAMQCIALGPPIALYPGRSTGLYGNVLQSSPFEPSFKIGNALVLRGGCLTCPESRIPGT